MNRKELILDFIKWYWHHHVKFDQLKIASKLIAHQKTMIDEYLEMLEAVKGLNELLKMKTWCIEFERELEGKDVIHVDSEKEPTVDEAIEYIKEEGYKFNVLYDRVNEIYEV
jgi:hypothetical protein